MPDLTNCSLFGFCSITKHWKCLKCKLQILHYCSIKNNKNCQSQVWSEYAVKKLDSDLGKYQCRMVAVIDNNGGNNDDSDYKKTNSNS